MINILRKNNLVEKFTKCFLNFLFFFSGKHCIGTQCGFNYTRENGGPIRTKVFESYDKTIKFFTKYGFCRMTPPIKVEFTNYFLSFTYAFIS